MRGLRAYLDSIFLFAIVNFGWAVLVAGALLLWAIWPVLLVIAPVLALPTAAFLRLAVVAARDDVPKWAHFTDEVRRRPLRKLLVAGVQLLVTLMAVGNLVFAASLGGVLGVATGLIALYALLLVAMYSVALWPILADPVYDGPLRSQLGLATVLVLRRPLTVIALVLISALAVGVSIQVVAPVLILPSIVLLVIAAYVVPQLDALPTARG